MDDPAPIEIERFLIGHVEEFAIGAVDEAAPAIERGDPYRHRRAVCDQAKFVLAHGQGFDRQIGGSGGHPARA
jgi:hypothetical protein